MRIILILLGIKFLINEIDTLAKISTNKTATDITTAAFIWTVTARAEQIPSTCIVIGLFSSNGSEISFLFFLENKGLK